VLQDFYAPRAGASTAERRAGGAIGLCMLVDRAAYEAAYGAFEELFFFFEDVEFALGLRLLGKEILFAPQAVVRHRGGTAGLSMRGAGARYPARRTFFHSRNRSLLLLTTARWRTLLLTLPSQALYELVQFAFSLSQGHGLAWIRGKLARLPLLPAVLRRRRLRQRTRVVADRDLFVSAPLTLHPGIASRGPAAVLRRALDRCFDWNWRLVRWACG
jgi:GT2 family glycosyltransferase